MVTLIAKFVIAMTFVASVLTRPLDQAIVMSMV
jgi:hypothetical protein